MKSLAFLISIIATANAFTFLHPPPLSLSSSTSLSALNPGSTVALTTPMLPSGSLDIPAYRKLLQWHVESGTKGLCVLGTTGEASTLSFEEREEVLKVTKEEIKDKNHNVSIIVGTGTINPSTCIKYSLQALKYSADASLIVTPYYVKPTPTGLLNHYKKIADAVPELPIILYNVPSRTGCDMLPSTVSLIKENCGSIIIGIKEATGDLSRVEPIKKMCGDDFMMWSGDDSTGSEFVLLGGDGVISVTANVAPKEMNVVMEAALAKDREKVEEENEGLKGVHEELFCQANPIPVKWALWKMGRVEEGIRGPLTVLEEEYWGRVEKALEEAGIL
ncbi:hypothetical protein TrVE_jg9122 [Triparma verrucosa]|uniref:4-hydroxy-tetrahydrodipicolinate synthase n=1 Tax=Triparma verrucosa TaxID=1606542 RepID=A0A9W7BG97_9STRA|nr:hypothetical protein TrVE_jg9122 [Triparma verrucosa]